MENPEKQIKTLSDDMEEVIKENRDGVIKKIIHQEEAKDKEREIRSPETPRNKRFLLFGTLLLILAVVAFAFGIFSKESFVFKVAPRFQPIIFNEEYLFLDVTDLATKDIALQLRQIITETEVPEGGVLGTYATHGKKVLDLNGFMAVLGSEFKATRGNFIEDNFMLGAFISKTKPPRVIDGVLPTAEGNVFILIQARSFIDMFKDMRAWEEDMFAELHPFFDIEITPETGYLLTKDFLQGVVHNRDARILYFDEGDIALMYVYADDESVVVTNSEEVAKEIILRLAGSKVKK